MYLSSMKIVCTPELMMKQQNYGQWLNKISYVILLWEETKLKIFKNDWKVYVFLLIYHFQRNKAQNLLLLQLYFSIFFSENHLILAKIKFFYISRQTIKI